MRYLFAVIDDNAGLATGDEAAAIDTFNEQLEAGGHRILAAGLAAPAKAVVIDNRGASPVITTGPVVDAAEHMAGFWVIEAVSDEQAHALAVEASRACNRKIEVRAFLR